MNHRGHPKNPIPRAELPLAALAESFLESSREEAPALAKQLAALDADGKRELGGVLGRLDARGKGELDPGQRLLARRVLGRLQKPAAESLVLVNRILDYLDLNLSALIEEDELELCVQVIELFARAESRNDTLSTRELEMLYAVLRYLDRDENGQLDPLERAALHQGLSRPEVFLAEQRKQNPFLRRLLAARV